MRGPLTPDELAAVLDPNGRILDEIVSASQGEIVRAMAFEIELHRAALATPMLRAARFYTDELGALRKRVAELEALPGAWAALTNEQRIELMALCCSSRGAMDPRCRCGDDS